jgi:hypothetical protein
MLAVEVFRQKRTIFKAHNGAYKMTNPFEKFWKRWDKIAEQHESGDFRWGYYAVKKELNALLESQAKKAEEQELYVSNPDWPYWRGEKNAFRLVKGGKK